MCLGKAKDELVEVFFLRKVGYEGRKEKCRDYFDDKKKRDETRDADREARGLAKTPGPTLITITRNRWKSPGVCVFAALRHFWSAVYEGFPPNPLRVAISKTENLSYPREEVFFAWFLGRSRFVIRRIFEALEWVDWQRFEDGYFFDAIKWNDL